MNRESGYPGPLFADFLREQGTLEEATEVAIKRVLAFQLKSAMEEQGISKAEMARRVKTSRSQLDRLLDPDNTSVSLSTLTKAAKAVGRNLKIDLV